MSGTIDNPCDLPITWTITVGGQSFSGTGSAPSATWDGRDGSGNPLPPGTYPATLTANADGGDGPVSASTTVTTTPTLTPPADDPSSPPLGPSAPPPVDPPADPRSPAGPPSAPIAPDDTDCAKAGSSAHMATGALNHGQELFSLPSAPLLQGISLSYATTSYSGPLGQGWSHNHDIGLNISTDGTVIARIGVDEYHMYTQSVNGYTSQPNDTSRLAARSGGGYVLSFISGTVYEFDANGKIESIRDVYGNLLSYGYTDGDLASVSDASGRSIGFDYDTSVTPHRLTGIRDPKQTTYSFTYNTDGRLQRVVLPSVDGGAQPYWEYDYYPEGRMKSKRDPMGNLSQYEYDASGRLTKAIDPEGVANPEGHTRSYAYDTATGSVQNNIFTEKDSGQWHYSFDAATGLVKEKKDPNGTVTGFTHYSDGRLRSVNFAATGGTRLTTFYTYNANGSVTAATLPVEGIDPATVSDPLIDTRLKVAFRYTYDLTNSNPIFKNRIKDISDERDPDNILTTSYDYSADSEGYLVTTVTTPASGVSTIRQHANGKVKDATDANDGVTSFTYRADGLPETVISPSGLIILYSGYDANGNNTELKEKDSDGTVRKTVRLEYDARNRLRKSTTIVTGQPDIVTTFGLDDNDNLTSLIDPELKETKYEYTYNGLVKKITDAANKETKLEYGTSGCSSCGSGGVDKLKVLEDAKHQQTKYEYDKLGRLTLETGPLGNKVRYTYYDNGLVKDKIDATNPDGEKTLITYTYNNRGQLLNKHHFDGSEDTFTYDPNGNLHSAGNQNISYTFTYYADKRLKGVTDSLSRSIQYSYDDAGNRTQMTAPDGMPYAYHFDSAGRLDALGSVAGAFYFVYDATGKRTMLLNPNQILSYYNTDKLGRLTELYHLIPPAYTTALDVLIYQYDLAGNRTVAADVTMYNTPSATTTYSVYTYDPVDRLLGALSTDPPRNVAYKYDDVGNRTSGPDPAITYTYNEGNELTQNSYFRYSYDNYGNLTSKTDIASNTTITYVYDYENQLVMVTYRSVTARYAYDPFGRRISKTITAGSTTFSNKYLYDGDSILYEYDGNDNIIARYTHALSIDDVLAVTRNGGNYYYHKDALGTVISLTDASGTIIQRYDYDAYGRILSIKDPNFVQPYGFTGREWDPETGLLYLRYRYYDPMEGRFIQKDPIGFKGGDMNLYNYVQNNPINRIDPFGLEQVIINTRGGVPIVVDTSTGSATVGPKTNYVDPLTNTARDAASRAENIIDRTVNNPVTDIVDAIPPGESTGNPTADLILNGIQIVKDAWNRLKEKCGR